MVSMALFPELFFSLVQFDFDIQSSTCSCFVGYSQVNYRRLHSPVDPSSILRSVSQIDLISLQHIAEEEPTSTYEESKDSDSTGVDSFLNRPKRRTT